MNADRRSARAQHGLPLREALGREWRNSKPELARGGIAGAGRFTGGQGRHGSFGED
jgi:enoyl-CoA hydratase